MFPNNYPSQESYDSAIFYCVNAHYMTWQWGEMDNRRCDYADAMASRCTPKVMGESELHPLEGAIIDVWRCFGIDTKLAEASSEQK